ncbi:MAG TPA: serpin family protein [Bacillota bacterium]|nr:serpin family protein [Bacillota bacterium]HOK68615.1 serpin family protein [Bacillota bacterium]HPP84727.1 serpin family protein [Bacillota bacterium]
MKKRAFICILLLIAFVFSSCSSVASDSANAASNGSKISSPKKISFLAVKQANGVDEAAVAFAIDMLKASMEDGKNCMISPLSILTALGMTANGADGETLKQMEEALFGGKTIEEFNAFYQDLIKRITNPNEGVVAFANSIWYRDEPDRLKMNDDFIRKMQETFNSAINPGDFNDKNTVNLINDWVKDNTNGYIKKIIEEISPDTVIYLINALYFEQKWAHQYPESNVKKDKFHTAGGDVNADYLCGDERLYIHDGDVHGFIKSYEGNAFSFVALMPKEGVSPEAYLSKLTGKKLLDLLKGRERKTMWVTMPKFKTEFEASLVEPLKSLGITDAFEPDKANFKNMAASSRGNLFVSDVLHKTFIEVNEAGTKAAAVTAVIVSDEAEEKYDVHLTFDRPFLYMIIDNQTNLPLFIGILNNPAE